MGAGLLGRPLLPEGTGKRSLPLTASNPRAQLVSGVFLLGDAGSLQLRAVFLIYPGSAGFNHPSSTSAAYNLAIM